MSSSGRRSRSAGSRSALGLTGREHFLLARFMLDSARERHGDGPWERRWQQAYNSADGRAFAKLARLGLIESDGGRPRAKIAPRYRWRAKP